MHFFLFFFLQAISSFPSDIINGNLRNIANNNAFWATAEGNATTNYCDLIVDWWPESWMHPVGYHVTVPCTGAAHRTFDSAWAAMQVGDRIQMHYAPDALRDRNRSTSAFGAAGLCRAHSVAMPMDVLNPIRLCTQADNQAADPFVPAPSQGGSSSPQWGAEQCASSPFSVPWDASVPTAPASIGTVPRPSALSPLALLAFNGWDVDGPQPLSQCASGADCCPTCQCLLTPSGGVCAVLRPGVMECLAHAHCDGQRMCAGDALCTQGLLEVSNPDAAPVSVRTFSSNCSGASLDTWGLSKEEVVPDVLRSSGMCSWRSWYEHRAMQTAGGAQCSGLVCTLPATETWNYTAPSMQPAPAFASGLLRTQAHACDVDYEHLPGLSSCSPSAVFRLLDQSGAPVAALQQAQRTRTYRYVAGSAVPQLPLVRHSNTDNVGAGFLGANLTYTQLGYDTYSASGTGPKPVLCSSLALCATQSAWKLWFVNGIAEANRTVGPSAAQLRAYGTSDMIQCGSMGYLLNPTTCVIDPAVVPLFYYYCNNNFNTFPLCSSYRNGQYPAGQGPSALAAIATQLNGLLVSQAHTVASWSDYLTYVDTANAIYASIQATRAAAGIAYTTGLPTGLYYLLSYSAYELPFAWWWRCTWMQGIAPGPDPVPCDVWDPAAAYAPSSNGGPVFNSSSSAGVPSPGVTNVPLLSWLAGLNAGVFTTASVGAARAYVQQEVAGILASPSWVSRAGFNFSCYAKASLRADLLRSATTNQNYARAAYSYAGRAWGGAVSGAGGGAPMCSGPSSCLDYGPALDTGYDLVSDVGAAMQPVACGVGGCTQCVSAGSSVCAYAQDSVPASILSDAPEWLDLFRIQLPDIPSGTQTTLGTKYDPKAYGSGTSGCNLYPTCPSASDCECVFTDLQPDELSMIGLTSLRPGTPPTVTFGAAQSLDVCAATGAPGTRCSLATQPPSDSCTSSTAVQRTTMSLYCSSSSTSPAAAYYPPTPMFSNSNPASDQCLLSSCFAGASIQNTLISIPPGVGVDVVYAPPIPCYNLSCDAGSANDGHVVLDPSPYTLSSYTQYRMYIYQTQYTYPGDSIAWRYHRIQMLQGDATSLMITKTRYCLAASQSQAKAMLAGTASLPSNVPNIATLRLVLCATNKLNTRSLSPDYAEANLLVPSYTPTNPSIPASFYSGLMTDLVSRVEDVIETVPSTSNAGIVCAAALPTDLRMCNFTNGSASNALAVAQRCSDDEALGQCKDVGAHLCSGRSNVHTYDRTKCDLERAAAAAAAMVFEFPFGFALAAAAEAIVNTQSPDCYQGPTDFEKCIADFNDLGTCRTKYALQCNVYVYQRDENHSPCTSRAMSCPYDVVQPNQARSWEQQYMDAGLPTTGFCPECYGAYSGCSLTKSTKTYHVAQGITGLHAFTTSTVANSTQLGSYAQYARIRLVPFTSPGRQHPVQCGAPTCPALQRPVQFRQNLYTCAPCFAAPLTECTGQHDCAFGGYGGFSAAYAAAKGAIQSYLNGLTAGLRPTWMPWLATWGFSEYNPHALTYGFNAAITKLNGQCKVNGALPEPSQCQNDGPRRTLRAHVQSQYKAPEGAVVPPGGTLAWPASFSQLVGVNLPAWEAFPRPSTPFLQALFSDDVCAQFTFDSMVCLQQPTQNTTLLFNPQIAGDFEIAQGCDTTLQDGTTRVITSACNQLACPAVSPTYDTYNAYAAGSAQTVWTACKLEDHTTPATFTTGSSVPTNLCGRTPSTPLTCTAAQGAFLGGLPKQWGVSVKNLYAYYADKAVPIQPTTLVQMATATGTINVGVGPWDMGGHYIRLRKTATGFALAGLPLRSYASLAAAQAMNATGWVGAWLKQAKPITPSSACTSWACPFRRRFYWTGSKPPTAATFSPTTPDPGRTTAVFGTPSHPSAAPTSAAVLNRILSSYVSANGFCVCPSGNASACLGTFLYGTGACSRADLIAALVDFQPRTAAVLGNATCAYQLDWPWVVGGPLRDGAYLPWTNRVPQGPVCPVLDRLPPFRYRFMDSGTKLPAAGGATTLDEGGDCHLARPVRVTSPPSSSLEPGSCVITSKSAASVVLACADGSTQTLPRPTSLSVLPTSSSRSTSSTAPRTRCTGCTPPPAFFVNNQTLPVPETSYGTPWRWSPSRLLARDLRFNLCGNATQCPQVTDWSLDDFWTRMLQGTLMGPIPSAHSINAVVAQASQPSQHTPDEALWSQPWLLCTTNGSGAQPWCSGSISKAAWLNGGDRPGQCKAVLQQPNAAQAAVDLSICDLDAGMNLLCTAVQQARYAVFEANCQLTGRCRTTAFFYQPATYAIDDNQFVRSVVGNFYNFSSAGACPVLDAETREILASNAQAVQQCPAQDLEAIQLGIRAARATLHSFVKILYYLGIIGVDLLTLVTGADTATAIASIMAAFNVIAGEFVSFFASLGDVFFRLIMETGKLGQALRALITQLCTFARDAFQLVIMPFLCGVQSAVVWLLNAINSVVSGLSSVTFGALDWVVRGIDSVVSAIKSDSMCSAPQTWECGSLFPMDTHLPTSLPMPTRCWVGYMPDPGNLGDGLGCSASDTCMDDDGTLKACAACETSIAGASYGCDSLTKLCRCHVAAVGQTQCASHQECTMLPDTECGFVDAYMQPSFGNVPCAACTAQPICLVMGGAASLGTCVCTLRPTSLQACSQVGARVVPDPAQLCLVSLSPSAIAQSAQYAATYQTLASAQCVLLNQAQSYCLTVYEGSTGSPLVVGLSLLAISRRRLLFDHDMWPVFASDGTWRPNATEWALADEPCRSVMQSLDNRTLGPYDRYLASECQRWRDIGERVVVALNLTRVAPVRFTSWTALLSALAYDDGALRQTMAKAPQLAAFLLSYHPLAQTATFVALRVWRVLPNRTALALLVQERLNQTMIGGDGSLSGHAQQLLRAEDIVMRELVVPSLLLLANSNNVSIPASPAPSYRSGPRRVLLLSGSWKDTLVEVQQFSTQIVTGQAALLAPDIAAQWSSGPFSWPPDYSADGPLASSSCLVATIVFNLTYLTMVSTVNYYTGEGPRRPEIQRSFFECLPRLPSASNFSSSSSSSSAAVNMNTASTGNTSTRIVANMPFMANDVTRFVEAVFAPIIDRDHILGYISRDGANPSQLTKDLEAFVLCDFDSVQHCTRFGRDLGWGAVVVLLGMGIVSLVARKLGIPGMDPILFAGYLPMVSVFVFGVSPLCWPMMCTCFVDELVHLSTYLLPVAIEWPAMLQYWPGCLNGTVAPDPALAWRASSAACFRPCTDWPFAFVDARDNLAWLTLRAGAPRLPPSTASLLSPFASFLPPAPSFASDWIDANVFIPMHARYDAKQAYIGWADMAGAQDTCCFLTGFNLVLLGVGLFCAAMVLSFVLLLPVLLLHFAYELIVSLLVYTHTH